jgi:hypothetical protein
MNEVALENIYREHLEESIIFCLSERLKISFEEAIDLYYNSTLANQIYKGVEGIQYLDYKLLSTYLEQELAQTHA